MNSRNGHATTRINNAQQHVIQPSPLTTTTTTATATVTTTSMSNNHNSGSSSSIRSSNNSVNPSIISSSSSPSPLPNTSLTMSNNFRNTNNTIASNGTTATTTHSNNNNSARVNRAVNNNNTNDNGPSNIHNGNISTTSTPAAPSLPTTVRTRMLTEEKRQLNRWVALAKDPTYSISSRIMFLKDRVQRFNTQPHLQEHANLINTWIEHLTENASEDEKLATSSIQELYAEAQKRGKLSEDENLDQSETRIQNDIVGILSEYPNLIVEKQYLKQVNQLLEARVKCDRETITILSSLLNDAINELKHSKMQHIRIEAHKRKYEEIIESDSMKRIICCDHCDHNEPSFRFEHCSHFLCVHCAMNVNEGRSFAKNKQYPCPVCHNDLKRASNPDMVITITDSTVEDKIESYARERNHSQKWYPFQCGKINQRSYEKIAKRFKGIEMKVMAPNTTLTPPSPNSNNSNIPNNTPNASSSSSSSNTNTSSNNTNAKRTPPHNNPIRNIQ